MNGKIFFRQISSGTTWTAWSNFYTTVYKPTPSEIGAAAAVHTHSYLPLSGGIMTGAITLPGNPTSNLHAATKQYVDSQIAGSGSGDMLKSVYDTDNDGVVDKAEKLGTARTITLGTAATATATSFDGSQNITIPVTSVKEAYLSWGGKNLSGSITPIDAALADFASGNRLFGTPASSIEIQVSRDGGSSWSNYPGVTDNGKRSLVSASTDYRLGGVGSGNTTQDQLRVTISAGSFYFFCRKVLMNISTNGATGVKVDIKYSTIGAPDTFKDYGTYALSGWSGWNSIPLSMPWGGSSYQTAQTKKVQFTFSMTGAGPAQVLSIYAYGENAWGFPNIMAKYGRSYDVDYDCNSTFRGKVTLKQDPSSNLEAATKQYVDKGAISTYTHSKTGTVHTLTGSGDNIRFIATADFTSGDTFKIGATSVTAKTIGGDSLWTGFFKNGAVVTCYKNGTTINFNGGGLPASELAKLTPENIKSGIKITANGKTVTGTFTNDGTAAAGDILSGKIAYVKGAKITGTIPTNPVEVNLDPPTVTNNGLRYNFNNVNTYYTSGYYWSPNEDITSAIKLTSDKLKSGEKVLGVTGSFTNDGTATQDDILLGKTAYVAGVKLTGRIPKAPSSTPATGSGDSGGQFYLTTQEGFYAEGTKLTKPSEEMGAAIGLTAGVLKTGTTVGGVRGTYTSDANAGSGDLRSGKTAYVNGQKISGGLASLDTGTPNAIQHVRLANGRFEVAPPAGIHGCWWDGGQYSYLSYQQVRGVIGLTAEKIAKGNTILGIAGTHAGASGGYLYMGQRNNTQMYGYAFGTATYSNGVRIGTSGNYRLVMFGYNETGNTGRMKVNGSDVFAYDLNPSVVHMTTRYLSAGNVVTITADGGVNYALTGFVISI